MKFRPNQAMAYFVLSGTVIFAIFYINYVLGTIAQSERRMAYSADLRFQKPLWRSWPASTALPSSSGLSFIFSWKAGSRPHFSITAICAIIYLCCDDLDSDALESLACLQHDGKRYLIIQDDSKSEASRSGGVDAVAERLADDRSWDVRSSTSLKEQRQAGL